MLIYAGKSYSASQLGAVLAEVHCEKCQCHYFYQLIREGQGREHAPLFLGSGHAERSALSQAEKRMKQRLETEAELVPCPECHWINEELVEGYRRTCYQRLSILASSVAILGPILSLVYGFIAKQSSIVPMNDAEWLWWSVEVPTISLLLAAALLGIQWRFRSSLLPNSNYPERPHVPLGTPPALFFNESTSSYALANPSKDEKDQPASSNWVLFQRGRHAIPEFCCHCLKPTQETFVPVGEVKSIPLFLCNSCRWALRGGLAAWGLAITIFAMPIGIGILWLMKLEHEEFWILSIAVGVFTCLIARYVATTLVTPASIRILSEARSLYELWFRNDEYVALFFERGAVKSHANQSQSEAVS